VVRARTELCRFVLIFQGEDDAAVASFRARHKTAFRAATCRAKSAARRCARCLRAPLDHLRQNRNFPNHFNLISPVQSRPQKYSALDLPQISGFISLSRLIEEGRTRRHERGSGMRWT
jgi:hypothetical protein